MTFHFLEDEQRAILFGDARQQLVEEITLGQRLVYWGLVSGVLWSAYRLFNYIDPPLTQMGVALVDGDPADPRQDQAAAIKVLDGEVDLGEDQLSDVLGILAVAQDPVDDRMDFRLVAFQHVAKGG